MKRVMRVLGVLAIVGTMTAVASAQQGNKAALGVRMTLTPGNVRIVSVVPGSPADHAGLQVGDRIVAVNQEAVNTHQDVIRMVGSAIPTSNMAITVQRGNETGTFNATLGVEGNVFPGGRATRVVSESDDWDGVPGHPAGYHATISDSWPYQS
jgi:C-terminal processing protease CtpA/Prc